MVEDSGTSLRPTDLLDIRTAPDISKVRESSLMPLQASLSHLQPFVLRHRAPLTGETVTFRSSSLKRLLHSKQ